MKTTAVKARVEGKVQGVFFRDFTRKEAERLGLAGWVRNMADGSVQAMICGQSDFVKEMIDWLHKGSPYSRVDRVMVEETTPEPGLERFTIRY